MVKIKIHVFPKETNYLYLKYWQQPICDDVQVIKLSQVKTSELCIFYILECHDSKSIQATRGQLYAELVATIKELNYLKDLDTASAIHLQICTPNSTIIRRKRRYSYHHFRYYAKYTDRQRVRQEKLFSAPSL